MEGFISLHRKLLEWEWYSDVNTKTVFIHCLLKANYTDKKWRGITIKRGQFFTSNEQLSNELNLSIKQIRLCLSKLEQTQEIVKKGANNGTMITVCKYDNYQINNNNKGNQRAIKGQSKGNQRATTNKDNKDNKENKLFRDSVYFDLNKIKEDINEKYLKYDLEYYYEAVYNWSESGGKKKIDWLATFRNFILRDIKDNNAKLLNNHNNMVY